MEEKIKIILKENSKKSEEIPILNINENKNKDKSEISKQIYEDIKLKFLKFKEPLTINKNSQNKIRNAGVDIIRLIGMYGIIINHLLYQYDKGGMIKYSKYSKYLKILHIFTFWHNNGFALISGIIGYKSFKYSNLLYLYFEVLFYSVSINIYFKIFHKSSNITCNLSKDFFPIIFKAYWYFSAYFGMYLFLPVINLGISIMNKNDFRFMVITFLFLFVFWRDIKNPNEDVFDMKSGFSMIWLLTYFIIGAYIGKYRIIFYGKKKFFFCLICLLLYLFSSFLFFFVNNNSKIFPRDEYYQREILSFLKPLLTERYDSILKVIQSISISLIFLQILSNFKINIVY